jgi:hypothetical protein
MLLAVACLESYQIGDQVNLQSQDGHLIKPVKRQLRAGWFEPALQLTTAVLPQEQTEAQVWSDAATNDDSESVW